MGETVTTTLTLDAELEKRLRTLAEAEASSPASLMERAISEYVGREEERRQLDEDADWAKVLSPGEQQRIVFARILLMRPKAVFLDEATSALDAGFELALYNLLRAELPHTVVVSVAHHEALRRHHRSHLELLGGGAWRLEPAA